MTTAHVKRWLSAVVAIPLLALVILKGGRTCFALIIGLAAVIGLIEYYALVLPGEAKAEKGVGLVIAVAMVSAFYKADVMAICGILSLALLIFAIICMKRFRPGASVVGTISRQVMGLIYVPFLLGHVILIRDWDRGIVWTCFLLAVVFAGDTGAYYVGKAMGRHKLSPHISPGKTVEGAAGGLAANLAIGAWCKHYWLPELPWGLFVGLVLFMGVVGQVGDLVESMLKRSVVVKDSGKLLPGHGGMLDRIDALLFASPALYYFKTCLL
ncbi:MAG: phosphatidate cytidylyltransferase [Thermodesulfobacteriota bacterium]|nr:phosphatidate cytidylyltransferase [Thermodesulfobacteriota bacterium]